MVYLLHSYFGRDGREEAEELLDRRSGNEDKPRILNTFNEPIDEWLSFSYLPCSLTATASTSCCLWRKVARSSLPNVSFMLTEEAHHMFVGKPVSRVIRIHAN